MQQDRILIAVVWLVLAGACSGKRNTEEAETATTSSSRARSIAEKGGPSIPQQLRERVPLGALAEETPGILHISSITGVGMVGSVLDADVNVRIDPTSNRVWAYVVSIKKPTLDSLDDKWGAAETVGSNQVWFNPKSGLRVRYSSDHQMIGMKKAIAKSVGIEDHVHPYDLVYERYVPFKQLLGPGQGLAFLPKPLIGQTPKQVAADYPEQFAKEDDPDLAELLSDELQFPGTEYTLPLTELLSSQTAVVLEVVDGKVQSYQFAIDYKDEAGRQQILDFLTEKFGTPKPAQVGHDEGLRFKPVKGLMVSVGRPMMGDALVIVVERGGG